MRTTSKQRLALLACGVALGLGACASAPSTDYRVTRLDGYSRSEDLRYTRNEQRRDEAFSERDELITSNIRAQFARDPEVSARDIDIETYRGTVELSGYADDRNEIRRAVKIALATPGVRTVRNDIRVAK